MILTVAGSFWHSRKQSASVRSRVYDTAYDTPFRVQDASRAKTEPRSKPPSKRRHDRQRSLQRDVIFQERREERLRLFGYVKLRNGETISIDEATHRLALATSESPSKRAEGITKEQIADWHVPESFRDVLDSLGEIDVPRGGSYPALGLGEGTVLIDPKIRHTDPALRRKVR